MSIERLMSDSFPLQTVNVLVVECCVEADKPASLICSWIALHGEGARRCWCLVVGWRRSSHPSANSNSVVEVLGQELWRFFSESQPLHFALREIWFLLSIHQEKPGRRVVVVDRTYGAPGTGARLIWTVVWTSCGKPSQQIPAESGGWRRLGGLHGPIMVG